MDEGIGPENEQPDDKDLLASAWDLVGEEFGLHWGYENGFMESSEHSRHCDCFTGKVYRGELIWCTGCQKHLEPGHECRAAAAIVWLTS